MQYKTTGAKKVWLLKFKLAPKFTEKLLCPANYITQKLSRYYIPQFHFSLQQN